MHGTYLFNEALVPRPRHVRVPTFDGTEEGGDHDWIGHGVSAVAGRIEMTFGDRLETVCLPRWFDFRLHYPVKYMAAAAA